MTSDETYDLDDELTPLASILLFAAMLVSMVAGVIVTMVLAAVLFALGTPMTFGTALDAMFSGFSDVLRTFLRGVSVGRFATPPA